MKKQKTSIVLSLVLFLLIAAIPAYASNPETITVEGNVTSGNYTITYINTTQLNSSIASNEYTWYRLWFNVSLLYPNDDIESATIQYINFTLPDTWVQNSTTSVVLYNSTHNVLLETANSTHSEDGPDYGRVRFNLTDYSYSGVYSHPSNITILNASGSGNYKLFAIDYKLDKVDDHRSSEIITTDGIHRSVNVTYPSPSNVTLENVTIYYNPSMWSDIDTITSVNANGTAISLGTSGTTYTKTGTGIKLNYDWDFRNAYNSTFLKIGYTVKESGKGGTGAGSTRPTTEAPPTFGPATIMIVFLIITIMVTTIIALLIYFNVIKF